jgi:DNA-binding transcriptional LysR family regulator
MDRFDGMSTLIAIVEHGSLSAAARALHLPVTTVSRRLSDLEASLGTRLLIRTTRKLTVTDTGAAFITAARRILAQVDEAEREAAGEYLTPRGELVLTAPVLFGRLFVLPVVADFLAQFDEINVRLLLSDRNVQLVDEHVDMAVRIGTLADGALVATRVGSMRTVFCCSPQLIAQRGMPRTPEELQRFPFISVDAAMSIPAGVAVVPRLTVSTAEAACDAAVRGVGVTRLLYYQVARAVQAGQLVIVLADEEPEPQPIHLVHSARGHMPLKMRRFIDYAAPRLRASIATAG